MNKDWPSIYLYFEINPSIELIVNYVASHLKIYKSEVVYKTLQELISRTIPIVQLEKHNQLSFYKKRIFLLASQGQQDNQRNSCIIEASDSQISLTNKIGQINIDKIADSYDQIHHINEIYKDVGNYEQIVLNWSPQVILNLRLITFLIYSLELYRCNTIIINNISSCVYDPMLSEAIIQILKGVLNNFAQEKFIFNPFRCGS
ncbi:hypothetical protein [Paenibacillus periandrae]|uniref:hypothetical protein n=1 Tax=Paenibacillus periandrae TaxID=1761741 RepID=UPI001F08D18B|nr:hypothetical protein [Paenibacillus periandrae]